MPEQWLLGSLLLSAAVGVAALTTNCTPQQISTITPPATFSGLIPCADCPGIRQSVTLNEDSTFSLTRVYLEARDGEDVTYETSGAWHVVSGKKQLVLIGEGRPELFAITDSSITMLDIDGNPIQSGLNYTLMKH
ncbi:copper resistance protein NlpE [bacterium]|nr:copper resistance protein NlpE [bacterium]